MGGHLNAFTNTNITTSSDLIECCARISSNELLANMKKDRGIFVILCVFARQLIKYGKIYFLRSLESVYCNNVVFSLK